MPSDMPATLSDTHHCIFTGLPMRPAKPCLLPPSFPASPRAACNITPSAFSSTGPAGNPVGTRTSCGHRVVSQPQ